MKTYTREEALAKSTEYFNGDNLAAEVFVTKYAMRNDKLEILEPTPEFMHRRLAKEFARIESKYPNPMDEEEIFGLFDKFRFAVPQGSPMFGVGNHYQKTSLGNCFVISLADSYGGICRADERIAQIAKRRGGAGADISPLRPKGLSTKNSALTTDGIVVFMERFSNTAREVAQCLGGDTLILTKRGLVPIKEIKSGTMVWTENKWVKIIKILKNQKDTVKIHTKMGSEIICSYDHIFSSDGQEKTIKEIGDSGHIDRILGCGFYSGKDIVLKNITYTKHPYNNSNRLNEKIRFPRKIDNKLAYILGYMYGDGYTCESDGEISLPVDDLWPSIQNKLSKYIQDVFHHNISCRRGDGKYNILRMHSKLIIHFLKSNNILKQKTKFIQFPSCFYTSKKEILFSFISGYMDADGSVVKSKKVYKFSSINKDFLRNIQNVLFSFGVVSKIHFTDRSHSGWNNIYNLTINGGESQKIFRSLLVESEKCNKISFKNKRTDWTQTIYNVKNFNSSSSRHAYICNNDQFLSYSTTRRLFKDLKINKDVLLIRDQITKIEKDKNNSVVYDLVLENTHLFSANAFYAHNSGRRGALMLSLSVHHPEILNFIRAKRDLKKVTGANISVRITDEFMKAVIKKDDYEQKWPVDSDKPVIKQKTSAKEVWDELIKSTWLNGEPGILFWDTIIKNSPADSYASDSFATSSTNPCGELPLSPGSSCILLLQNITSYVLNPFTKEARLDENLLKTNTRKAQKLMDDMVDLEIEAVEKIIEKVQGDPENEKTKANELDLWQEIRTACTKGRRTGLGITGLGDCLAMLNIKYGSKESLKMVEKIFSILRDEAYRSSIDMSKERGSFPIWDAKKEEDSAFLSRLPEDIKKDMKKYGRRNIACLTVSPAGSVSTQTQTSSGFEPVFMAEYTRKRKLTDNDKDKPDFVDASGDKWKNYKIEHHGLKLFKQINPGKEFKDSPYFGAQAQEIDYEDRVKMQGLASLFVDHAISSTINLPNDADIKTIDKIYLMAYEAGCKGITIYRDGSRDGVLTKEASQNTKSCDDCDGAGQKLKELVDQGQRPSKIILSPAPKRPAVLECEIHRSKVGKGDWLFFVGMLHGQPYEIFGGNAAKFEKQVVIPQKFKKGWILKNGKGKNGLTQYHLILGSLEDKNETMQYKDINKHFNNKEYGAFTRLASLSMRHGTPIKYICEQITKEGCAGDLFSFQRAMSRILKKYISDGEKSEAECPMCGSSDVYYKNGCPTCKICGNSNCS
jgi:ribonucleoside-diphosphate reductase alpha chain